MVEGFPYHRRAYMLMKLVPSFILLREYSGTVSVDWNLTFMSNLFYLNQADK